MILIVDGAVQQSLVEPNTGNGIDHIYNIGAHKGNHSRGGHGVLKFNIKEMLEAQDQFDYYMNL